MTWYSLHRSNSLQPLEEADYSFPSKQAFPLLFPAMALVLVWLQGNLFSLVYPTETNLASFLPVYQVSLQHHQTTIRANPREGVGLCNLERGTWEAGLPLLAMEVAKGSRQSGLLLTFTFIIHSYSELLRSNKFPIAYQPDCREHPSLHLKNFLEFNHIPCTTWKRCY